MSNFEYPKRKTLDDKEMFDEVVNAILSVLGDDAQKIILYGSVARGDNTWESDVDIAVITKRKYNRLEYEKLDHALAPLDMKHDTLFSIVIIDSYKFFIAKYEIPFYRNVNKEGIILWKKQCA